MAKPRGLSKPLLIQLGRIATTTAYIEQEFVLWASTAYSNQTGGVPTEDLRVTFRRLLNKWHSKVVHQLDRTTVDTFIRPLRISLEKAWPLRNRMLHGRWRLIRRNYYELDFWEQTKEHGLRHYKQNLKLREVRLIAEAFDSVLKRLYRYFDSVVPSPSLRKSGARPSRAERRSRTKRA